MAIRVTLSCTVSKYGTAFICAYGLRLHVALVRYSTGVYIAATMHKLPDGFGRTSQDTAEDDGVGSVGRCDVKSPANCLINTL